MASKWPSVRVAEIAKRTAAGPFGSSISSKHFMEAGVPVIRGGNLSQDVGVRLNEDGLVFLSNEKAAEFSRSEARRGDLVFTCWGTIDQVGLIDERARYQRYIVSNKQMLLTPDTSKADSLYLYYYFASPKVRADIVNRGIGSSVPGFNLGQLRGLEIPIPPLTQQKTIARILGTLDDKIELNRRMNATLEAMARALFKSWFVNFDPVHAKAAGRQPVGMEAATASLFPDSFQESELGEFPKGWRMGKLGDISVLTRSSLNPGVFPHEVFDHYSLPAFDVGRVPKSEIGENIKSNKLVVPADAVLLSKLNPHIPRIWIPEIAAVRRSVCSTEFLVASPQTPFTREFLFALFTSTRFSTAYSTLVTGTTGSHQRIKADAVLNLDTILPSEKLVSAFTDFARPLFLQLNRNTSESRALAALRDVLLPKLLSGELDVASMPSESAVA